MTTKGRQAREKHPLLLYRRLAAYYRAPLILLLVVSAGLVAWDPPELQELRRIFPLTLLLSLILLVVTLVMSRLAYVQCVDLGLRVQLPLYRLYVGYDSIVQTRSVSLAALHPPSKQPFSSRGFLYPLWHLPAVVVDLEWLPESRARLRLWMDSRMIIKKGLVFLVEDHRTLRRQIDEAVVRWRLDTRDTKRESL